MEGACQHKSNILNILDVNIKYGKIQRLELATAQPLRFFYKYDEEQDAIIVYMSLSDNGAYERMLFACMPNANIVERLLSKFFGTYVVDPEVAQRIAQYVEKITADINRRGARIKIDGDSEGWLQGLTVEFGYRWEENRYYVYAGATGYYEKEEYQCSVHERDYVDEYNIKPRLMSFIQNVVEIASTCVTN